jgi:hypothetical protein
MFFRASAADLSFSPRDRMSRWFRSLRAGRWRFSAFGCRADGTPSRDVLIWQGLRAWARLSRDLRRCGLALSGAVDQNRKPFTTEGTEDHGEKPTLITPVFGEANNLGRFTKHACYRTDNLGGFTAHLCRRTDNLGWLTKPARYQTYVQILSVDNDFPCVRY